VAQRVGPNRLGDPSASRYTADDPPGTVPVQPPAVGSYEDGPVVAFADGQVDRPRRARRERDGDDLAALAGDHQGPLPPLDAQVLNVGARGFGDAQPVEGKAGP
jgi:diadenosine tetraphosphatase ApaH/serine/threonine PP2A family protein phosphatase